MTAQDTNDAKPNSSTETTVLSVIMPVRNEEHYVDEIIRRVMKVKFPDCIRTELVVVDDCSNDKTDEKLEKWKADKVKVIHRTKNGGKGAALRTGFAEASGDVIAIQDADLEYDPEDLVPMIKMILSGEADAVFGARRNFMYSSDGGKPRITLHYLVNKFLTVASNVFSGLNLHDMECCYKMFRRSVLDRIVLTENRFGFEPEITLKISRLENVKKAETGVSYNPRTYAEGKKVNWKDGISALRCIVKYGLFRR